MVPPQRELPRRMDPPERFIVNANQHMTDEHYPYTSGREFENGHRTYRIAERLAGMGKISECDQCNLRMPGGQSGHPLSPRYRDQQAARVEECAQPFAAGPATHQLALAPAMAAPTTNPPRSFQP